MDRYDIPNGFTGRPQDDPDFESAAEASRRVREAAMAMANGPADPEFLSRGRFAEQTPEEEPRLFDIPADYSSTPAGGFYPADYSDAPADDFPDSTGFPNASVDAPPFESSEDPEVFAASNLRTDEAFRGELSLEDYDPRDTRWAWAEIDLSAIRHNIAETRRFLDNRCRLMAVVKADAYGHGAVEVSKAALAAGADRLAVATVAEGIELRQAGITAPIMILSQPPVSTIPFLVDYNLVPSIYDAEFAVAYGEAADQAGRMAPYHLVINTGMNRIGVHYDDVVEFLYQISFHRALVLEGTFTHFATADCHESLEFERQRRRFEHALENIRAAGFDPGIVHAANSAAIFRYPQVHYDMVRLGIALYGFHPCIETEDKVDLRPAMSIHARITDTHRVPMSEGVSYGLQYRSPGSVLICTVPLGYADGLRVGLSNDIDFIMGGRYYHQVGRICMDQCMFEVDLRRSAAVPYLDPQVGDPVIIVGSEGAAQVTIDELAEKLGTIHYEVAIGFGQRLPHIYK